MYFSRYWHLAPPRVKLRHAYAWKCWLNTSIIYARVRTSALYRNERQSSAQDLGCFSLSFSPSLFRSLPLVSLVSRGHSLGARTERDRARQPSTYSRNPRDTMCFGQNSQSCFTRRLAKQNFDIFIFTGKVVMATSLCAYIRICTYPYIHFFLYLYTACFSEQALFAASRNLSSDTSRVPNN